MKYLLSIFLTIASLSIGVQALGMEGEENENKGLSLKKITQLLVKGKKNKVRKVKSNQDHDQTSDDKDAEILRLRKIIQDAQSKLEEIKDKKEKHDSEKKHGSTLLRNEMRYLVDDLKEFHEILHALDQKYTVNFINNTQRSLSILVSDNTETVYEKILEPGKESNNISFESTNPHIYIENELFEHKEIPYRKCDISFEYNLENELIMQAVEYQPIQ